MGLSLFPLWSHSVSCFVPVRPIVMPSTSWNRLFRCFEDCRFKIGGILVDTVLGEGDQLGVDVSQIPKGLQSGLLFFVVVVVCLFFCLFVFFLFVLFCFVLFCFVLFF